MDAASLTIKQTVISSSSEIITTRRYTSAVYAVVVCASVCPSVNPFDYEDG